MMGKLWLKLPTMARGLIPLGVIAWMGISTACALGYKSQVIVLSAPLYFTLCDDFHCIWCFPTYGGSAAVIFLEFQEIAMSLHCWCLLEVRMARVQ